MTLPRWHEESIARTQDRQAFDCGDPALNDFLRRHARQSHEHGGAKTFLAIADDEPTGILGFYSLAPASIACERVPETLRRGLARHDVPGFRLARLAAHVRVQGQGLGGQLLGTAARRCLRVAAEVGGVILIIDAKTERAAQWYASYGAVPLRDTPHTLVMALATFVAGLKEAGQI